MEIKRVLKIYMFAYWPEKGPFSRETMSNYSIIEMDFEESRVFEDSFPYHWEYKDIGSVLVSRSVDYVKENIIEVCDLVKKKLAKAGKLRLEEILDGMCYMKINNITQVHEAAGIVSNEFLLHYYKKLKKGSLH